MQYKSIRLAAVFSLLFAALAMLGFLAVSLGPLQRPAPTTRVLLIFSGLVFSMLGLVANSAVELLERQASRIDALEQKLAGQRVDA